MMRKKETKKCPCCLNLLGESTRTKIISQLKKKPSTVSQIEANFALTQPTISYHLKALLRLGMLKNWKRGREVFYYLNKDYPCRKCNIFKLPFKA